MDLLLTLGYTGDTAFIGCLCGRSASTKGLLGRQDVDPAIGRPTFRLELELELELKPRLDFLQSLRVHGGEYGQSAPTRVASPASAR